MIVFDLRCANAHIFEAWFGSSAAFASQSAAGQVRCPFCDSAKVEKAAMAPNVATKGNRSDAAGLAGFKEAVRALAAAQAQALKGSEWVGRSFATRARAMHVGDEAHATIHGQATVAEARSLAADGVPVAALPLPVTPPETLN